MSTSSCISGLFQVISIATSPCETHGASGDWGLLTWDIRRNLTGPLAFYQCAPDLMLSILYFCLNNRSMNVFTCNNWYSRCFDCCSVAVHRISLSVILAFVLLQTWSSDSMLLAPILLLLLLLLLMMMMLMLLELDPWLDDDLCLHHIAMGLSRP